MDFKGVKGLETDYCRKHGIRLTVPKGLVGGEFADARETAFRDACLVWNAVDSSKRPRIKFPEMSFQASIIPPSRFPEMEPAATSPTSHTTSDSDSAAEEDANSEDSAAEEDSSSN